MSESSFLQQLEQRTQQVKITLANLEAERTRIEGLIGQLQPLVPHYDALLQAERTLVESNVPLDEAAPSSTGEGEQQPQEQQQDWEEQHRAPESAHEQQPEHPWQG